VHKEREEELESQIIGWNLLSRETSVFASLWLTERCLGNYMLQGERSWMLHWIRR